jgi:hypothetical protein
LNLNTIIMQDAIPSNQDSNNRILGRPHVIGWKVRGMKGHQVGRSLYTKAAAEELAERLNDQYPDLFHWAQPA